MTFQIIVDAKDLEAFNPQEFMNDYLHRLAEVSRRYAVSISPVITGSYRDAHKVFSRNRGAVLTIDPRATNGDVSVTRYAANVEEIHKVYSRTELYAEKSKDRMGV